jgi:hypothetical protein
MAARWRMRWRADGLSLRIKKVHAEDTESTECKEIVCVPLRTIRVVEIE